MATSTGRKTGSGNRSGRSNQSTTYRKSTGGRSGANYNKKSNRSSSKRDYDERLDSKVVNELIVICVLAVCIFLFLCNFEIVGEFGNGCSKVQFGIFGLTAYFMPILLFIAFAFGLSNEGSLVAKLKLVSGIVLFLMIGVICELLSGNLAMMENYDIWGIYRTCSEQKTGGGILAGSIAYLCYKKLSVVGTVLVVMVIILICIVLLTGKQIFLGLREKGVRLLDYSEEDSGLKREQAINRQIRRDERLEEKRKLKEEDRRIREENRKRREEQRAQAEEERQRILEEEENEKILRMDKKVSGVMVNTSLTENESIGTKSRDDIHEIMLDEDYNGEDAEENLTIEAQGHAIHIENDIQEYRQETLPLTEPVIHSAHSVTTEDDSYNSTETTANKVRRTRNTSKQAETVTEESIEISNNKPHIKKKYEFPPISLLKKAAGKGNADSSRTLKETAIRLQQTLNTFGVKVNVTDISQGPAVTRYELQPEQGVKVSKIVGLADDIKLNLAATDIRIEAPIPGKAAVGIEVPNKENTMVALRDLLEAKEFKDFPSKLAFAVGKDIGGQVVVTDIAKMPHMLIAGATGSGKSVCINTIIMSILYKADPDEVKLIMIDPKVVELSVYNGIPHLLIPVVTDPKKASAALHWGVAQMTERYKLFADQNVRDLKGYNKKIEGMIAKGQATTDQKLPQILIIVDELADLMMVSPGEVEESICRLAQLARAAGIHLVIATQRPSVDVITGLIKANMPSRVAFAVSSGVDSRTILDMNGAEKLLGKGDMLFYPQGYPKPARIQGAFVSDKEVQDVVDFVKDQREPTGTSEEIEKQILSVQESSGDSSENGGEYDEKFLDAGRLIVDKEKASIGMLQRVFKIGFNRAARIMDQLCEAGVVGEEEGTKPRKVLMSKEDFENFIEENDL